MQPGKTKADFLKVNDHLNAELSDICLPNSAWYTHHHSVLFIYFFHIPTIFCSDWKHYIFISSWSHKL